MGLGMLRGVHWEDSIVIIITNWSFYLSRIDDNASRSRLTADHIIRKGSGKHFDPHLVEVFQSGFNEIAAFDSETALLILQAARTEPCRRTAF
jgi:response regulator RpfG family c-di-GMP phosphodiesterase